MALYKAEGVVLRTRNLGEADRIVTLYTREKGKVDSVARGSRRTRSRLIGGTQIFTHGRYMLFTGRSLDSLSQAEIQHSFAGLREDLTKMAYASYMAELLDLMVEPGEASEDLFYLITEGFLALDESVEAELVARWFEFNLLSLLGYQPQLAACVGCGENDSGQDLTFSSKEGGLLCPQCRRKDPTGIRIRRSTVEILKRLLATPGARLGIMRPSTEDLNLLDRMGRAYVDLRIPRPLKSLGFLASIKDLA